MGEGIETNALQLLANKLNPTDQTRLVSESGLRTLTRRLRQRTRQGWTATEIVNAITQRDLTTANNIAAVLITRINDLGTPPTQQTANLKTAKHNARMDFAVA